MAALTIDLGDRPIAALREAAAPPHTTVDAIAAERVAASFDRAWIEAGRGEARGSLQGIAARSPSGSDAGPMRGRGEAHIRTALR